MNLIQKARREWFGGIIFSESAESLACVDAMCADRIGLPRIAALPEGLFRAPVDVHLTLTTRCHQHCPGCHVHSADAEGCDLPYDTACHIIDRLSTLDVFTVDLSGGEPFLHPQLFELAGHLRQRNIAPIVSTTGAFINEQNIERCRLFAAVRLGCHQLRDLEAMEPTINLLVRERIRTSLNLLVSRENFNALPSIFSLASRRGIARVFINLFKRTNKNDACAAMQLPADKQRELYPLVVSLARRYKMTPIFDCAFFPAIQPSRPKDREVRQYDMRGCTGANMTLAVDVNGNIRPCPFWPEHYGPAENLTPELWLEHPLLQFFRAGSASEACYQCGYLETCAKGCRLLDRQACGAHTRTLLNQDPLEPQAPR